MRSIADAGPFHAERTHTLGLRLEGPGVGRLVEGVAEEIHHFAPPDVDDLFDVFRQIVTETASGDPENSTFRLERTPNSGLVLHVRRPLQHERPIAMRIDRFDVSNLLDLFRQLME